MTRYLETLERDIEAEMHGETSSSSTRGPRGSASGIDVVRVPDSEWLEGKKQAAGIKGPGQLHDGNKFDGPHRGSPPRGRRPGVKSVRVMADSKPAGADEGWRQVAKPRSDAELEKHL